MRIFTFLMLLMTLAPGLSAQKFVAVLSKKKVEIGQRFTVTFEVENIGGQLSPPSFKGLQLLSNVQANNMQISNGKVVQFTAYKYTLVAKKVGRITIGRASLKTPKKTYRTQALSLRVVKASGKSKPSTLNASGELSSEIIKKIKTEVFIRANLDKTEAVLGEQLMLKFELFIPLVDEIQLKHRVALDFDEPGLQGFWSEAVTGRGRGKMQEYKGKPYNVFTFRHYYVYPLKTGTLEIEALDVKVPLLIKTGDNTRMRSLFSDGNSFQGVDFSSKTKAVAITVSAPPTQGKPKDFDGAVGEFSIRAGLNKKVTQTGQALIFTIRFNGTGNVRTIRRPSLSLPQKDFEVLEEEPEVRTQIQGTKLYGQKTFQYKIIPLKPGAHQIPSLRFIYYDPTAKKYKRVNTPHVQFTATGKAIVYTENPDDGLTAKELRALHLGDADLHVKGSSFFGGWGFWILFLLPLFLYGALLKYSKDQKEAAKDIEGIREQKAENEAQKHLQAAKSLMKAGQEKDFYNEIIHAIWTWLEGKKGIAHSEMSRERILEMLNAEDTSEDQKQKLMGLLDECEMAIFAPGAYRGNMQEIYQSALDWINNQK